MFNRQDIVQQLARKNHAEVRRASNTMDEALKPHQNILLTKRFTPFGHFRNFMDVHVEEVGLWNKTLTQQSLREQ